MKDKLIVFDWNGTILCDTRQTWLAGNECLKFYGATPMSLAEYRRLFTFPIMDFYEAYGVCPKHVLRHKEEANAVYQNHYEDLVATARTRRGARVILDWLHGHGASTIILSNYVTDKIESHLSRLDIGHYFQAINAHTCNGTSILEKTSKAQRLADYMNAHGYRPDNTIIIGDTMEEPEIARTLGLTSIGITDGGISRARLRQARPDHIIHRLDAMIPILTSAWQL